MLCKLQANAFDRRDVEVSATGIFVDPVLAMANHSCVPNATVQAVGGTVLLMADGFIEQGDEVEISYIGMYVCRH
jgi:SET and MYND domain-containing protein